MFPTIKVLGAKNEIILVQGGMGVGVSLAPLAGAVAKRGGVGIVSSIALDYIVSKRLGRKVNPTEAVRIEVEEGIRLSAGNGLIAVNVMSMLDTYEASVRGAVAGGAGAIFAGAGLPLNLPDLVEDTRIALVPIVSSGRALDIICRKWYPPHIFDRPRRLPDAVVVEGPLAGGHIGIAAENIEKPGYQLANLLHDVLEVSRGYGGFPVIVAGGIWDRTDIIRWINADAAGVQMGTRFLATHESGASPGFKEAVVNATAEDIIVATDPGSPSGMPFRIIRSSPGYQQALVEKRAVKCSLRYMIHNSQCRARSDPARYFCICNALTSAIGYNPDLNELPIFTVGKNADRVDRILSVNELMDELTGYVS